MNVALSRGLAWTFFFCQRGFLIIPGGDFLCFIVHSIVSVLIREKAMVTGH